MGVQYINVHIVCVLFRGGLVWADFTHILQGYFTGTGAIIGLPQCQWGDPEDIDSTLQPILPQLSKAQQNCVQMFADLLYISHKFGHLWWQNQMTLSKPFSSIRKL